MKNLPKADQSSIEDRRGAKKPAINPFDEFVTGPAFPPPSSDSYRRGPLTKPQNQQFIDDMKASASAALRKMGNEPLPSRRPPKGNNPGSIAKMKFPKTARQK